MKVYVAQQSFCDDERTLGVFSTLDAAKAACGESINEWTPWGYGIEGVVYRDDEWGPVQDYPDPLKPGSTYRTQAHLRWFSRIITFDLDVQRLTAGGHADPWGESEPQRITGDPMWGEV
jgi:hypothetical protein